MRDDETNDVTSIFGPGNFVGGVHSRLGVDAYLGSADDPSNGADILNIGGDVERYTEIIVKNTNGLPSGFNLGGIDVVEYGGSVGNACNGPCRSGDAFFISPDSPGYIEIGGAGAIESGLFAWFLFQDDVRNDFELRGLAGPGPINAPGIITGAQNIFYSTASVVEDHSYAHQFVASGGGGADLAVDAPVYEAPAASGSTRSGFWVKAGGSWIERDTSVTENQVAYDTGSDQEIYSILGGADMKWSADSPWRIGLFGGYVTSNLDFDLGSDSVDYEGGVVGGHLAFNNGVFYADATVTGDILNAEYSFAGIDVDADVTNIGVLANTGYRMHFGGAFLEPVASFAYVHSEADDFTAGGGTVEFSNGESLRAGAGARIGTTFATGGATTELSLLGKVWNEFEDENKVTVSDGVNSATFSDDISGVFGEVMANVTVTSGDGTLSGFVQGGGKFGDDFTSWDAQVGVRKGF